MPNCQLFWKYILFGMANGFAVTLPLANRLQSKQVDTRTCYLPTSLKHWQLWEVLQKMVSETFFPDAQALAAKLDRDHTSANCGSPDSQRHRHCRHYPGTDEFFWQTIYISFLENITSEWPRRPIWWSPKDWKEVIKITCLLNSSFQDLDQDDYDILRKFSLNCQIEIAWQCRSCRNMFKRWVSPPPVETRR